MKRVFLPFLLVGIFGLGTVNAAPKGPTYMKQQVKQALLKAYAAEIQQTPKLKVTLEDESKKPFRMLFNKVRANNFSGKPRIDEASVIQSTFLNNAEAKKSFIQESGMKEFMTAAPVLAPLTREQMVQLALEEVFAKEIKDYPGLKDFLNNKNNQPYKNALGDLDGLRDKNLASLKSVIQGTKNWYIRNTGIGDAMFENSNAPQDDETRREWLARTFPEDLPSGSGSGGGSGGAPSVPTVAFTDFTPKGGLPGTSVTIEGKNLGYTTGVLFNGLMVDGFSSAPSGISLSTLVPHGVTSGFITLTSSSGNVVSSSVFEIWSGQCSNADLRKAFTQLSRTPNGEGNKGDCDIKKYNNGRYNAYKELLGYVKNAVGFFKLSPPRIIALSPAFGPPETQVTIEAERMEVYLDDIKFNGNSIPFRWVDSRKVAVTIPANATAGDKEIKIVSNLHGEGKGIFKIAMGPEIHAVNPNPVEPARLLTITGTYFDQISRVDMVHKKTDRLIQIANFGKPSVNQLSLSSPTVIGDYFLAVFGKFGRSQAVTFRVVAPAPPPPVSPEKLTVNSQGHHEYCFGAVGNGCGGFGENAGEASTRPAWLGAGCHEVKSNGTRDCWVAQGSIMHDNCCVVYPYGQNCGGKYADGSKASLTKHDGHCVKEWADAMWDVAHGHAWLENFKANEPADITPISSARYGVGETPESARLCAPDKTNITDRYANAALYCCAKQGQRYWSSTPVVPVIEEWITCGPPPEKPWFGILSVGKQMGKKQKGVQQHQPPPRVPVAYKGRLPKEKIKPMRRMSESPMRLQPKPMSDEPLLAAPPPPPPPSPASKQQVKPQADPSAASQKHAAPVEGRYEEPQEEEVAQKKSPAESELEPSSAEGQPCAANVPRYQQRGCVEAAQPREEVRQPQVCERGEWSTTLRMCVE